MKYYDRIPENFLMIRFVATRYCNYRCPYCYVPLKKRTKWKTMFSHHTKDEWLKALKENFSDKYLEFYFTGGEPLIVKECVLMIKELVNWENVHKIRIDSNISLVDSFLKEVQSEKIEFLTAFHPTQTSLEKYLSKVLILKKYRMLGIVNFVASKENLKVIGMPPHKLIEIFEKEDIFLNVAKDFMCKRYDYSYDKNYKEYIDMFQYPLDRFYMDGIPLNKGYLCAGGKHYIFFNRHGNAYSCGNSHYRKEGLGNIFDGTLRLKKNLCACEECGCPSIVSYSFSSSNNFNPINHIKEYIERCRDIRKGLKKDVIENKWKKVNIDHIWERNNLLSPIKRIIYKKYRGE